MDKARSHKRMNEPAGYTSRCYPPTRTGQRGSIQQGLQIGVIGPNALKACGSSMVWNDVLLHGFREEKREKWAMP